MKSIYLIFPVAIFLLFACNEENNLFEVTPESDLIALEGMEEAYERASIYNDSLLICFNESMDCDLATQMHYDELFHQFEGQFDAHHANYSHNNLEDDHHHEGGQNIRHGSMMNDHGIGGDENEDGHGYEHDVETLEMMMDLRELHEKIHPG